MPADDDTSVPAQNPHTSYQEHVAACRACRKCGPNALNLDDGGFAHHPSPWAMWMGALSDVDVVIVGQDFASQEQPHVQPDPTLPTNVNLLRLLSSAGIDPAHVYLTNAVLCLKPGLMSAPVPARWVKNCASNLRQTIELVRPRAVASLGALAWRGVCHAYELPNTPLSAAIKASPQSPSPPGGPALFAFAHCGRLGIAQRPLIQQEQDWARLGRWIALRRAA